MITPLFFLSLELFNPAINPALNSNSELSMHHLTVTKLQNHVDVRIKEYYMIKFTNPEDSILEAVLTVSPNKQYRGIFKPTTPATTIPVCTPNVQQK